MTSNFALKLSQTADGQWSIYHLHTEGDQLLSKQIQKYWTDLGYEFPGVQEQWSAVFVSWCLKTAGAKASEFKFAERHAVFVKWSIDNAKNNSGLFRGHPIADYSPKMGDIVANNQPGNTFDFAYASAHDSYHSHSAIVVERGIDGHGEYVLTVGGNEGDSVRQKIIYLKNGLIPQRDHMPFIAVIEDLK